MSPLQNHLVIMVKVPQIGATKTRLAKGIGAVAAWRFYRQATDQVVRRLSRHGLRGKWKVWLAETPERLAHETRFWPVDIPRIGQGRGGLGTRMARPLFLLPPGPVVVIGSDIPDIQPEHIEAAFCALDHKDAVFGPAQDGGYWLVGFRRRPALPGRLRPSLFHNVRWSTGHALKDTLVGLDRRLKVAQIMTLSDVDTAEDYAQWRKRYKWRRR